MLWLPVATHSGGFFSTFTDICKLLTRIDDLPQVPGKGATTLRHWKQYVVGREAPFDDVGRAARINKFILVAYKQYINPFPPTTINPPQQARMSISKGFGIGQKFGRGVNGATAASCNGLRKTAQGDGNYVLRLRKCHVFFTLASSDSANIPREVSDIQGQPMTSNVKDQKPTGHNSVFKAVLIYENFTTGMRARRFFKALARASDKTVEEQMWNFEVLGIREARNAAASAARKADVVAVSISGQLELPGTVQAWFDMWLWLLEDENPALIALFDSSATPNIVSIRAYLSCVARRAGVEFFLAHRQVSLVPVVRSKEEETWPKSVEGALLSWLKLRAKVAAPAR